MRDYVSMLGVLPDRVIAERFGMRRAAVTNARWRRGLAAVRDPNPSASREKADMAQRFWSKVNKDGPTMPHMDTPCWVWTASTYSRGYGKFLVDGRLRVASHVAVGMSGITIPPGMEACHACDNPPCVNPAHIWIGTQADNVADMVRKGRHVGIRDGWGQHCRGENNANARLTDVQVDEMRNLYANKAGVVALASRFGVHRTTVRRIVRGRGRKP